MHYAIGDIQGNLDALKFLLNVLKFKPKQDYLYFLGDVVNRGKQSLETLLFIKNLCEQKQASMVLGNHDYHLLVCGYTHKKPYKKDTLDEILAAHNKADLLNFLRNQPLLIQHKNFLLTHAGIPPQWDEKTLIQQAKSVEKTLKQSLNSLVIFLKNSYQNTHLFSQNLSEFEQNCYTINALMRMRFCTQNGQLEFDHKANQTTNPQGFKAWFEHPRQMTNPLIFGHWSNLTPINNKQYPDIYALDTGCIWGRKLSAMCLETRKIISINC